MLEKLSSYYPSKVKPSYGSKIAFKLKKNLILPIKKQIIFCISNSKKYKLLSIKFTQLAIYAIQLTCLIRPTRQTPCPNLVRPYYRAIYSSHVRTERNTATNYLYVVQYIG